MVGPGWPPTWSRWCDQAVFNWPNPACDAISISPLFPSSFNTARSTVDGRVNFPYSSLVLLNFVLYHPQDQYGSLYCARMQWNQRVSFRLPLSFYKAQRLKWSCTGNMILAFSSGTVKVCYIDFRMSKHASTNSQSRIPSWPHIIKWLWRVLLKIQELLEGEQYLHEVLPDNGRN